MSTIHVYLSSFLDSRKERRTGLARVEHEVARELVALGAGVIACAWTGRGFVALDFREDVEPIAKAQDISPDSMLDIGTVQSRAGRRFGARILCSASTMLGGSAGINLFALVSPALTPEERQHAAERLGLFDTARAAIAYHNARSRDWRWMKRTWRPHPSARFAAGDVILVPGIIWRRWPLAELERLKHYCGIRVVAYVHDLMPVRCPKFFTDNVGVARFRRHIDTMVRICDEICVSSDFVASDLDSFARESGRTDLSVIRVPLCAQISLRTTPRCTPRLAVLGLQRERYALYVSSLNVRKNHAGIYSLWRSLMTTMADGCLPPLVFAGQRGWGTGDLVRQMSRDTAMWGRSIHFVEGPTDAEVAHLYSNCAFTVFPSHYEGWGLGVTESLEFAKPCIAADNTALREAGQGLAIHIDTQDGPAWAAAIRRLSEDEPYRRELAARIQRDYRHRTWSQVGEELFRIASGQAGGTDADTDFGAGAGIG
jgi:glycosyltransferase involved in cell wall biosynthesis